MTRRAVLWSTWALGVSFGLGATFGSVSIGIGLYREALPWVLMATYSLVSMIVSTRKGLEP